MKGCGVCGSSVEPVIFFGRMPLANGFLRQEDFSTEYFYDLTFGFCSNCRMAQLIENVPLEKMFHAEYPFFSSTSSGMTQHFRRLAHEVAHRWLQAPNAFVVEVGSNDGALLRNIAPLGIRHLGVEPSGNVAKAASSNGVETTCRFFDPVAARDIVATYGQADVVLATNCFCHIQDLHSLAEALEIVLKPVGVLIFEDPYLGDLIGNVAYDQIYDEHSYYFSILSVDHWLTQHGFETVDVRPQTVHGGSMRYVVGRVGTCERSRSVDTQKERELNFGLQRFETYLDFRSKIHFSREKLLRLLQRLKNEGRRVVGYAATSKSTTVLNYCEISTELIEFISDTTPIKQWKYSPGMHIPVRPPTEFESPYPDYALLFAWNHAEEITNKELHFNEAGGRWIRYVPRVEIVGEGGDK